MKIKYKGEIHSKFSGLESIFDETEDRLGLPPLTYSVLKSINEKYFYLFRPLLPTGKKKDSDYIEIINNSLKKLCNIYLDKVIKTDKGDVEDYHRELSNYYKKQIDFEKQITNQNWIGDKNIIIKQIEINFLFNQILAELKPYLDYLDSIINIADEPSNTMKERSIKDFLPKNHDIYLRAYIEAQGNIKKVSKNIHNRNTQKAWSKYKKEHPEYWLILEFYFQEEKIKNNSND